MPALGMAQETGRLVSWLKREGEAVTKGEPLMEVETDKAVVEVEAPGSGLLGGISVREGDEVPVGRVIAYLLGPGEEAPVSDRASTAPAPDGSPAVPDEPASETSSRKSSAGPNRGIPDLQATTPSQTAAGFPMASVDAPSAPRPPASPKARRLAQERGLDLARLHGSGPAGAVIEADLTGLEPAADLTSSPLWRAMADNTARSWREAPHFFLMRELDASQLIVARSRYAAGVTFTDLLVALVGRSLARHRQMNSGAARVAVGLAVALEAGLIVPVIQDADKLPVEDIAQRRQALVERAQSGRMRAEDLAGATFTISNLGMYGVDAFTAIVSDGQAGILAVGRIGDRVVPVAGVPQIRPTIALSLSCDHRRIDGARGARFLSDLVAAIEEPAPHLAQAGTSA